ncbi:hypothetical protein KV102_07400 [Mumia sp. zg.B53]|uniref:hypothetical protein n=1 Tax=unclassified Mumia TaxID=2621872 RepID=UPI001C6EA176|nr:MULTISPECIES: hypothetical protein [unclassified Mumia]MBW9207591.1 hypothetical protein [Mumia sp. zg.B17]MBW9210063.1 hypothetical protein [Mumia sp. zg.B21]MBW9214667.1 hypothetical protein [Mumia sp. zg.B53]MDD9348941.1 hypothetical protein [Mumia sp.]
MSTAGGRRAAPRRSADTISYIPPVREPRFSMKALRAAGVSGLFLAWLAGFAVALTSVAAVGFPDGYARYGAALLAVVFTAGVARRSGGRSALWATLVAILSAIALLTEWSWAMAAASVLTATFGAVLAVLMTRPAESVSAVVREYTIALVVATSAAVAVAAWNAPLVYQRYYLLVLGAALAATFGIVWSLGAGLHGLGRRGVALIVGGAGLVAVLLVYGTIVRSYGSPGVVEAIDDAVVWLRETIGGVPRPTEVLIGFPALVWGVSTRSNRRQGWWMCAFGVVGTAVMATALGSPNADTTYVALSTLYSAILGLGLGLAIRALDPGSTSRSGRRAARRDGDTFVRPEPPRFAALK